MSRGVLRGVRVRLAGRDTTRALRECGGESRRREGSHRGDFQPNVIFFALGARLSSPLRVRRPRVFGGERPRAATVGEDVRRELGPGRERHRDEVHEPPTLERALRARMSRPPACTAGSKTRPASPPRRASRATRRLATPRRPSPNERFRSRRPCTREPRETSERHPQIFPRARGDGQRSRESAPRTIEEGDAPRTRASPRRNTPRRRTVSRPSPRRIAPRCTPRKVRASRARRRSRSNSKSQSRRRRRRGGGVGVSTRARARRVVARQPRHGLHQRPSTQRLEFLTRETTAESTLDEDGGGDGAVLAGEEARASARILRRRR